MTATLVAMAVEEGRLSWDATIAEILPEAMRRADAGWRAVTVAQLLEHRAGAPADAARLWTLLRVQLLSRGTPAQKRALIIGKILRRPPIYPPGSQFVYSSLDYFMIASMLERVEGRTYEELVRAKLWAPLGIASGGFGAPGTGHQLDQPWGHWGAGFLRGHPVAPGGFWGRLSSPGFYGMARMTMSDWAKFISLHLRGDPANPHFSSRLLTGASFGRLHRAPPAIGYESGWFLESHPWAGGRRPGDSGRVLRSHGRQRFLACGRGGGPGNRFRHAFRLQPGWRRRPAGGAGLRTKPPPYAIAPLFTSRSCASA